MMKPRKTGENTYVYDIPMHGVPMDGIDVTQGGECVYGKHIYGFKDLLYGFRGNFSCGRLRVVPSGQDSSARSWSSCHIIR